MAYRVERNNELIKSCKSLAEVGKILNLTSQAVGKKFKNNAVDEEIDEMVDSEFYPTIHHRGFTVRKVMDRYKEPKEFTPPRVAKGTVITGTVLNTDRPYTGRFYEKTFEDHPFILEQGNIESVSYITRLINDIRPDMPTLTTRHFQAVIMFKEVNDGW